MNIDETTEDAARRELEEETGLKVKELHRINVFDAVGRDPRERVITVAYYTIVDGLTEVRGRDDATVAEWFPIDNLPPLAFDHDTILREAKGLLCVE